MLERAKEAHTVAFLNPLNKIYRVVFVIKSLRIRLEPHEALAILGP